MNVQGTTGGRIDFSYTKSEYGGNLGKFLTELPLDTLNGNNTANKIPHITSYKDYKLFSWLNKFTNFNTFSIQLRFCTTYFIYWSTALSNSSLIIFA